MINKKNNRRKFLQVLTGSAIGIIAVKALPSGIFNRPKVHKGKFNIKIHSSAIPRNSKV
ncbi:MAG: hypothetical protein K9J16_05390 [Melioribacteraceae bacterium]|nr:hypothetical protein [Melioribacteraceae bacterium]MCF8354404.1 hypothetical protein [Melioribacteraceae bacterium]MCF8392999.1 hypothetical protein [Melioribacteraceae bacterium]MCF8417258.1 hypothetical protein [Melioribacteraceae bacterium]